MKAKVRVWNALVAFALLIGVVFAAPVQTAVQAAGPTELFFSEYVEGSSYNKALEIYNGTGVAVDLAAGEYKILQYSNGSSTAGLTVALTGTVADGDVYVFAHSSADAAILAIADQTSGAGLFNGDDALVLQKGTTVLDVIGQIGYDPGTEWGSGLVSTADNTLRRKPTILTGDPDGSNAFDPALEWIGYANNTFDGLGSHTVELPAEAAPFVVSTSPTDGATFVPVTTDITVTFSEAVDVTGSWFDLTCSTSGNVLADVTGGPVSFTLDPVMDLVNESCTLTIYAASVADQDSEDPPDTMVADFSMSFDAYNVCLDPYTEPWQIQGSGLDAAITGTVTSQGVVIGDFETGGSGQIRGFYIQSLNPDGDLETSDGIFVYNSYRDDVNLGEIVRVTGSASDYQGQTQISVYSSADIVACGTGSVDPVDVEFPLPSDTYLERYEGMLVRLAQTMYVTEHYQLGRFGQVTVSYDKRLAQPTNVVEPGVDALALQAANNLRRIILDDGSNIQNPDPIVFSRDGSALSASNTLRGGDTISGAVGVMTYTWGGNSASPNAYRVHLVNVLGQNWDFVPENERPAEPGYVSGTLEIGALNLLNYFNTFSGCTNGVGGLPTDCRGAENSLEFSRQTAKTVAAIVKMDVDVLGIIEIENDGYGPESAIAYLVDQLNAATAPGTYAFIDVDAGTEQINALGIDAIKVGFLYKPAMVTPVGKTAALNTEAFVNGGDSEARNRPALAQAFQQNSNGSRFIAVVNHLKSKGSACDLPDQLDGQGNCNEVRVNAVLEMAGWLASDPTLTGDPDIVILGDLNSYAMEDPIAALEDIGFSNLISLFLGPDAYSYVFDGQWGYLDHALASPSLVSQVTGIAEYHINADEPSVLDYNTNYKTAGQILSLYAPDEFRVSDHDPVIIGLDLQAYPYPSDLGFVTGGGWVPAPEGSFFYDPAWTGKVKFEFDVMYKKEDVSPQGSFYLLLEGAGFELTSSAIDWLTISADGTKAIFTGSGMADETEYRYMVWLQDGKRDNIRIQVWDGTQLVFDNQSLQRLTGNISIHR